MPPAARLDVGAPVRFPCCMRRRFKGLVLAWVVTPAVAFAWTSASPFSATVHGHEFKRVSIENAGCVVKTTLQFSAPEAGYREPAKVRNYYRFKARARFASGKEAVSPIFFSQKPGDHKFEYAVDTTAAACWGNGEQKVIGVDVEGCRGKGCSVEPFQN